MSDGIRREWTTYFRRTPCACALCGHIATGCCGRVLRANCNGARGDAHARGNEGSVAELTLLKEDVLKGAGYNPESTDETGIQCRANGRRTPDGIRDNGRNSSVTTDDLVMRDSSVAIFAESIER